MTIQYSSIIIMITEEKWNKSDVACSWSCSAHLLKNEAYCVLPYHRDVRLQFLNLCICFCQLGLKLGIFECISVTCLERRRRSTNCEGRFLCSPPRPAVGALSRENLHDHTGLTPHQSLAASLSFWLKERGREVSSQRQPMASDTLTFTCLSPVTVHHNMILAVFVARNATISTTHSLSHNTLQLQPCDECRALLHNQWLTMPLQCSQTAAPRKVCSSNRWVKRSLSSVLAERKYCSISS